MMKAQRGFLVVTQAPWRPLLQRLGRWREVRRERRLLAGLSDDALRDIGLNPADVRASTADPCWRDPLGR
ncbi:DUF1127 domain-containing protein [Pseudomonas sp. Irchel 3E20]|uniref:DUF1127 domain-containing protein n=1 Tax=Pseudomonas sp. Irchel 3E20 TaxID=2008983 RepID=UPI0021153DCC|nr:DUF1127 domain-containing protein [Pseudomonas sp. Irchel 3E20]